MDLMSFAFAPVMGKPAWMWLLFMAIVLFRPEGIAGLFKAKAFHVRSKEPAQALR